MSTLCLQAASSDTTTNANTHGHMVKVNILQYVCSILVRLWYFCYVSHNIHINTCISLCAAQWPPIRLLPRPNQFDRIFIIITSRSNECGYPRLLSYKAAMQISLITIRVVT